MADGQVNGETGSGKRAGWWSSSRLRETGTATDLEGGSQAAKFGQARDKSVDSPARW